MPREGHHFWGLRGFLGLGRCRSMECMNLAVDDDEAFVRANY
jgi:hypothetical protein